MLYKLKEAYPDRYAIKVAGKGISENPERTLMFLNLLEIDRELYDVVHYGILNETYILNGDEVTYPEDMSTKN